MISAKNISKSYKSVRALSGFSYDFERGIYAILGPNGSGKSTLMNIMTGNLKASAGTHGTDYRSNTQRFNGEGCKTVKP